MAFTFVLFDEAFELWSRKQLQKLTENAAYSIQGGASWLFVRSAELQSTYQRRRPYAILNLATCGMNAYSTRAIECLVE